MSDFDLSPKPSSLMKEAKALSGQADTMEKSVDQQRQDLYGQQDAELARRKTERDEMTKKQVGVMEDMKSVQPPKTDMPNPDLGPQIDQQKTKTLAFGLIALSLAGRGAKNWGMASAAMDGMLKGFREGSVAKYQENRNKFEREMRVAKEKQAQALDEYQKVLDNKKLSLNQMMVEISAQAAGNNDWDINMAAKQKNLDAIYKSIDSKRRQAETLANNAVHVQSALDMKAAMIAASQSKQQDKGWSLMKDKAGTVYRVNVNAGLQQKQTKSGWEDVSQLPPDVMHIGAKENQGRMFEEKAGMQYNTLKLASKELDELAAKGQKDMPLAGDITFDNHGVASAVGRLGIKKSLTDEQQQMVTAAQLFGEAAGHLERGATLTDQQFQRVVREFIPQPGDSDGTLKMKKAHRDNILRGAKTVSGEVGAKLDKEDAASSSSSSPPPMNSKGWQLHEDAHGNKAYVSPDGKQFEEVQ